MKYSVLYYKIDNIVKEDEIEKCNFKLCFDIQIND